MVVSSWGGRVQFFSCSGHIVCVIFVAHNFTELDSGRADYGYLAFGEFSRFVYCLLQKVKRSNDLPVIEMWEAYMLPNLSCFGAVAEEHFLEGTRLLSSLEKINSSFLRKEFRRDCRRFVEDFVSIILSKVAARSPIGQGLSCFSPEIVIGGDDYSAFHLFGQLLDGLLDLGWIRGSEMEPAKAEFHSSVREQRQVETSGNRSRVPINSVFAFCNQPGFRSRRNLHEVSIMRFEVISIFSWSNICAALDLSVDSISGEGSFRVASRLYCVAEWGCNRPREGEGAVACVQDFVRHPLFTQRGFFFETGIRMFNTAVTAADLVQNSARFDPWGAIGVEASPVFAILSRAARKFYHGGRR